jgi:hypothetical protein
MLGEVNFEKFQNTQSQVKEDRDKKYVLKFDKESFTRSFIEYSLIFLN